MKYSSFLFLSLVIACGKSTTESTSKADSLRLADSIAAATQTTENDNDGGNAESEHQDPVTLVNPNSIMAENAGRYKLMGSEAERGSYLTLTFVEGSTFEISITKMVADFCSGSISGQISFDESNYATFEADGHPVTVSIQGRTLQVQDPERHLGVGECEYGGNFLKQEGEEASESEDEYVEMDTVSSDTLRYP